MTRTVKIAAVQMIARPAPLPERLSRAERLIAQAAGDGAQLVVLPELFNTGYEYSDANYQRAEPENGPTLTWMKQTAARYGVHLAGTFLIWQPPDIYNSLFVVSPAGRTWRYDKNHPWAWERAYFRAGREVTVADTELGKLGLLICWDAAHPALWARYAGRVDAMVVCSCPPAIHEMTILLPDGKQTTFAEGGPLLRRVKQTAGDTFGRLLRRQAVWLGVPVVNTTATGNFTSAVPLPRLSLLIYTLARPDLWRYIPQGEAARITSGYLNETYVADAAGRVLQQVPPETEAYALAEVTLAGSPPQPRGKPPAYGVSAIVYLFDVVFNALLTPVYRRGVRRFYPGFRPGD